MSLLLWSPLLFYYYSCQSLGHIRNTRDLQIFPVVKLLKTANLTKWHQLSCRHPSPSATLPRDGNISILGKRDETILCTKISDVSLAELQTCLCQIFELSYCTESVFKPSQEWAFKSFLSFPSYCLLPKFGHSV